MSDAENADAAEKNTRPRARKGRPVVMDAEERRRVILDALDDHFTEVGLDGMTMSAIARRAGMSKQTLYGLFEDRDALFDAYVERLCRTILPAPQEVDPDAPLETRLRQILLAKRKVSAWDLPLALLRLAVAQANDHPKLSRRCQREGPAAVRGFIRQELDRAVEKGELPSMDTEAAAVLLKDMVQVPILDALVNPDYRPTPQEIDERFELGLRVFLKGIV